MLRFITKRIVRGSFIMAAVVILVFLLFFIMPGNPARNVLILCGISGPNAGEIEKRTTYESLIVEFQEELNHHYADSSGTPLLPEDWANFTTLEFFKIDPDFNVMADFTRIVSEPFGMQTSTDRKPIYEKYGEATFTLKGVDCKLSLFQSHSSREDSVWKHYLFLPYKDFTSGNKSYGGGKFIEVLMPEDGKVHIDFNKSYNPYCAYNHKYSCPIPPEENYLEVEVLAGVKAFEEH